MPNSRFDVLDFYRYAGALFVALDHFMYYIPWWDGWVIYRLTLLQPLMGFFFTLSGFVIMHVYERRMTSFADYGNYLQKRLARVYPLHLATLVIAVLGGYFLTSDPTRYRYSTDAILPNVLLLHAWNTTNGITFNYPSWSVSAELFVYLLFPLFLVAVNRFGSIGALLLSIACAAAIAWFFNLLGLRPLQSWMYANYDFGCLRAVPSFLAGMAVYRLATVRFANLTVPGWAAHGLAIATIPMMVLEVPGELILAIFVLVVFLLARAEPSTPGVFSKPLFRALANCSYGFYMLHALVGAVMLNVVPRIFRLDGPWMYGLAAAAMVVTTAVAVLSFRYFEDPARRKFGNFRIRWQASSIVN